MPTLEISAQDVDSGISEVEIVFIQNVDLELPVGSGRFYRSEGSVTDFSPLPTPTTEPIVMHATKIATYSNGLLLSFERMTTTSLNVTSVSIKLQGAGRQTRAVHRATDRDLVGTDIMAAEFLAKEWSHNNFFKRQAIVC